MTWQTQHVTRVTNHWCYSTKQQRGVAYPPGGYSFFALRRVSALFCVQKLFFLSSAFHTLHFSALQKPQRNAEHRSKMQNSAFSVDKRIHPRCYKCEAQQTEERRGVTNASLVTQQLRKVRAVEGVTCHWVLHVCTHQQVVHTVIKKKKLHASFP